MRWRTASLMSGRPLWVIDGTNCHDRRRAPALTGRGNIARRVLLDDHVVVRKGL
jgi:hypothetical protein